jgi:hypothetical protein
MGTMLIKPTKASLSEMPPGTWLWTKYCHTGAESAYMACPTCGQPTTLFAYNITHDGAVVPRFK